ncbi:nucleotidyltransferase domain-containing protein [Deinococcus sonorensis]|uniref:Nucleotidyltransferase domain-containing protein n=2 Tax=Deinococcus sonorensis TaxID=309891 RepID=A0AAU7U670_9DEIO
MSPSFPSPLLERLLAEIRHAPVRAVAISGSYARGNADAYSDLDLVCYVPQSEPTSEWLGYRDGLLVSIDRQHVEARIQDLTHPESAVRAVMPLRRLHALYDPEGVVVRLQRAAQDFQWSQVALQGQAFAAEVVTHQAEVIHKLLGGLARGDAARTWSATTEVVNAMMVAMAVWRGVLADSGNTYAAQVWEAMGPTSAWSRLHRKAAGIEDLSSLRQRGETTLTLYTLTAQEVEAALSEEAVNVVTEVRHRIEAAGYTSSSAQD